MDATRVPTIEKLYDQNGDEWIGNSSFNEMRGVNSGTQDRWKTELTEETITAIEAVTHPEMFALDYPVQSNTVLAGIDLIAMSPDQFCKIRPIYEKHDGWQSANLKMEQQRIDLLYSGNPNRSEIAKMFHDRSVYQALREQVRDNR